MQFLFPLLTWGFLLVLIPLLIHLINLMRQKRVKWAAMEFLLKAHKKHRKWVWLKQFLLLASRMLAVALIVAMLANLVTKDQWTNFFGAKTTHHIVLLDDSYSMSDIMGSRSSFDRADQVLQRLAGSLISENSVQRFTLMRFSGAARGIGQQAGDNVTNESDVATDVDPNAVSGMFGQFADINAVAIDADFEELLQEKRRRFGVSKLAAGPQTALRLTSELVKQTDDERPIVYVVSDFRTPEWESPTEILGAIAELEEAGAKVNMVRCAEDEHANLAITDINPTAGTRAAGVPLFVDVTVRNYGTTEQTQVAVGIQSIFFGRDGSIDDPAKSSGAISELPNLLIERIAPGESVTRRAQVYFANSGQHVVSATLPADTVEADNQRWCVVDFPDGIPVLVVDGDPQQLNAAYLQSVFQPGERVTTGIRPESQTVAFLRDAQPEDLEKFRVIYLLDVPRLDQLAMKNIENYVRGGGGLAVFMGPNSNLAFYQQWATERGDANDASAETTAGFFPAPTDRVGTLPTSLDGGPSLLVEDHPIFNVLLGEGKVYASLIQFQQFIQLPPTWQPSEKSSTAVIASLNDGSPLAIEQASGDGRVVVFLTTLAPIWNSWATQPTFPVMLLQTQSYLDSARKPASPRLVGEPLPIELDPAQYQPSVDFLVPGLKSDKPLNIKRQATAVAGSVDKSLKTGLGIGDNERATRTDKPGVYEVWPRLLNGELKVQRYVMNVDSREGELALTTKKDLANTLAGTNVELFAADDLTLGNDDDGGFSWSQFLMYALIAILILEQILAYLGSYHSRPARRSGSAASMAAAKLTGRAGVAKS